MQNNLKEFWESCDESFSHIDMYKLASKEHIAEYFNKVVSKVDVKDKVVIDYGVGGGVFAKVLVDKGIKKYIGYDIAERQINKAKETISEFKNKEFHLSNPYPILKKADIFICLAVIQHFPNKEYYIHFMELLNNSGIETLYLQIRYNDSLLFGDTGEYTDRETIRLACYTNSKDLLLRLSNYTISFSSPIESTKYQYLIFNKKG